IDRNGSAGGSGDGDDYDDDTDEFLEKAIDIAVEAQQISVSYLQRRLKVGHSRAGRIIDQMEDRGIIGPAEGSKPRQVRISASEWMEMKAKM
ncbi:MAG: DNA translocase FtsK, partial [Clostridia bacterium]|nr:DNA translocase FtsK [Clostridia bacterium]